jgi:anti-repressor protein
MKELQAFQKNGWKIRTVQIDGETWFVGKDIAESLGYTNPQKAVRDHCKNPRPVGVNKSFTPLDQQTVVISEPDLYRLAAKSNLPEAQKFEAWVFEEVLPTIRKTGQFAGFILPPDYPSALRALADQCEVNIELKEQNDALAPKAAALDTIANAEGLTTVKEVAKRLGVGEKTFWEWLRNNGVLYQRNGQNIPFQKHIDAGRMTVKENTWEKEGKRHLHPQPFFTAKGLAWISKAFVNGFVLEAI